MADPWQVRGAHALGGETILRVGPPDGPAGGAAAGGAGRWPSSTCRSTSSGPTARRWPSPADLDAFWATTLAEARGHDLAATFTPVDTGLAVIDTFDVTFAGFGGAPIRGWLHLPAGADAARCPAVVEYIGYGGGRGLAHERILWARPATPTS